ncbi:MAG: pitrilysin family protein [bacterium]
MPQVRTDRLPNGLTTVLIEVPSSHQVLLSLLVRAGSRFDPPGQAGLSHFVEHALFRGNASHPDTQAVFESFERVGEILGAQTGVEYTEFFQVVHPDLLSEALAGLSGFARTPIFPEIEKEKRIILDEILYDYNDRGQLVRLDAIMAELLWGGHPIAQSVTGTRETVAEFGRDDVQSHYAAHYRPANAVLAMAGRLEAGAAQDLVSRTFGGWGESDRGKVAAPGLDGQDAPRAARGPKLRTVPDSDNQLRIQLSFPTSGYRSADEIALGMLAGILDDGPNSRLQRTLREERALVYYIGCSYTAYADAGQVDISTTVSPDRAEELLEALFEQLQIVREGGVGGEELEAAKRRYRFDLDFSRDSLDAALDRYAWPLLYTDVRTEEAEWAAVSELGASRLSALAAELFARERLHMAVVGPLDSRLEAMIARMVERY